MATFPLYQNHQAPEKPNPSQMNMGLWFERYFHGYESDFSKVNQPARSEWLRDLNKDLGDAKALRQKTEAIYQMATAHHGQAKVYRCTAPFVTGMGNPHPLENGFTWHPTLGMPYLPGSSVKGLVRAAIEIAYQGEDKAVLLQRWFGTAEKKDVAEASGSFIFLDALPTAPCQLKAEVMTPHMGKWYENGGKKPLDKEVQPGDWHSPVPVSYLTARNLSLQFVVLPRAGNTQAAQELEQIWQALDYALQWLGAGGKTAQGFGAMEVNARALQQRQQAQAQAEQAQRMASLSPAQQLITAFISELSAKHQAFPNLKENPNAAFHNKARELAKSAHEGTDWSAEDKRAAAEAIETWLPKLVQVDIKDERKKLKLSALKGL